MKFTGIQTWRSLVAMMVVAGAAMAQSAPPPPTAPATPLTTSDQDQTARDKAEADREAAREKAEADREAARTKRDEQRAAERAKQAEARAKAAEDRARRVSTARVYMFGEGSYLGVDVQDVTKDRLPALKMKEERGAEVTMVDQDGPAGKAGLKEGDVILSFNGDKVESAEQLKRMIHETPSGRSVPLGILRNGQSMNLNTQLADRRELARSMSIMTAPHVVIPPMPPMPPIHVDIPEVFSRSSTPRVGISVESLTPQLAEFFGAPNGQGLLVRSVEKGSPADQAGIKAGDVIVKVSGERIDDSGDWRMTMREKTGTVPFTIMRDKREQTVTVKLPERRSANSGMMYFDFDSHEWAANMKDFEKQMKDWQKQWEKNGKDWEKMGKQWEKFGEDFQKSFQADDDDDVPVVAPKKPAPPQPMKKPTTTIILKDKTAA